MLLAVKTKIASNFEKKVQGHGFLTFLQSNATFGAASFPL